MAIKKRRGMAELGRRYYALIDDITDAELANPYSRSYLLLDAVESQRWEQDGIEAMTSPETLALIRAISTPRKWQELVAQNSPLLKGDWIEIMLDDAGGAPLAWEMRASQNYVQGPARSIRYIRRLGDGVTAATADEKVAVKLNFSTGAVVPKRPTKSAQSIVDILSKKVPPGGQIEIFAIDVGQASANLVKFNNKPIFAFDAGAPIWFNKKSLPRNFSPPLIGSAPIILSHWDFDHFDLGRRYARYRNRHWYAPYQLVGPNTAKFQNSLGSNLVYLSGSGRSGAIALSQGTATSPKDRNGTGYQLRIAVGAEVALLTGDASYGSIQPTMLAGVTAVTIPHHSGRDSSPPPAAGGVRRAVASFGVPNGYRHPDPATQAAHIRAGWSLEQTAATPLTTRGNRRILP